MESLQSKVNVDLVAPTTSNESSVNDNVSNYCSTCNQIPCDVFKVRHLILHDLRSTRYTNEGNNIKRKHAYKDYIKLKHGQLKYGHRVEIPACVLKFIRKSFPDANDEYMGFKIN